MTTRSAPDRASWPRRLAIALVLATAGVTVGLDGVAAASACAPGDVAWETPTGTRCIHVDDDIDLGGDRREVRALDGATSAAAPPSAWAAARDARELRLVCDRSADRHRAKVLYAYTAVNRLGRQRASINRAVALAQSQYDLSSAVHGARYSWIPRFVTEAAGPDGCRPAITPVRVSGAAVASPDQEALFTELEARGFDDPDLSYVVMVDTDATTYCGLGTSYRDDRPDPSVNRNDDRPQAAFARIDRWCWDDAVAHELAHNLGAVQPTAPNATSKQHCTDGLDAMCYDDGSPGASGYRTTVCKGADAAYVLDCNADDYFSPAPGPGSWLAKHWNIADSSWLLRTNLGSWSRGGTVGASGTRFDDVSYRNVFALDVHDLAGSGVTKGCNPPANSRFCPSQPVLREQMAAFIDRAVDLPSGTKDFVDVPDDSIFRSEIQALAAAGITRGCNPPSNTRFCPKNPVTREQMAVFLTRVLDLPPGTGEFRDVPRSSQYRSAIQSLAAAGITRGCNPPTNDRFCPTDPVTREQMAAFLDRAGLLDG